MQRFIKWLAVITSFDLLCVLLGGALVTKTGSGQGCGKSWPLCNGELLSSHLSMHTIIELSHRLTSGSAGILVTLLCVLAWKYYGHVRETKTLAILSFAFLVAQALMGAAAVVWGQVPAVLAIHFGISLISFAAVILLTLLIFEIDKKFDVHSLNIDKKMKFHIYGVTIYSYIVVYTGALVRHEHASLACPTFPLCSRNSPFPTQFHEWVQMGHRFAATLIFVWILYAMIIAIRQYKQQAVIYYGWITAFGLVMCQAISGILVVFTGASLTMSLLHSLFISCLFAVLCYLVMLATRSKSNIQKTEMNHTTQQKKLI
ncbi:heme A synthase [Bacillus sp. AFS018417]|uniref:COX15/CtaA family protein n=1 Tax=unclassified Bacillus (in: firmicutes) TaxID=185979 RepID=UPI000BF90746|nr:heme A synthase [Bacillus sp. AFS018417]PEZ10278.1 heme A synthase [Bacillus sp. AFS018417]